MKIEEIISDVQRKPGVRALLFDLGGVLIEIDFDRVLRRWQPISQLSFAEMRQLFKADDSYCRHERGEIGATEYFPHLRAVLKLQGSDVQIAQGWNAVFIREIRETMEIVEAARAAGLQAVHVRAPRDVRKALREAGMISP